MGTKNNTQTVVSDNGVNNKLNIEVMNIEKEQVATLNANVNAANAASVELKSNRELQLYMEQQWSNN